MTELFENVRQLYEEAFQIFDPKRKKPIIDISFYPYVGINHTIRVRNGQVFVRVAEICRDMPLNAHKGLAYILVAKLFRKKVPIAARDAYSDYIKTTEVRDRASESKKTRGRKIITSSRGEAYDLDEMFNSLNRKYFRDLLPKPVLTWSARKTYRILGHHDATHDTVVISKSLDAQSVPTYVVEYVVFHEMLHVAHPTKHVNGRRYNHTPAFRRDERKFQYFEEAELWIERNVRKLKRNSKR
jgi:Predicted metal-dependent hydrolase